MSRPHDASAASKPTHPSVGHLMSREVTAVRSDLGIDAASDLLLDRGLSGAPVIDRGGLLVGMITQTDLVREAAEFLCDDEASPSDEASRELPIRTVGEVMSRGARTIEADAPLTSAAQLMIRERLHRLAVVDADGRLAGMLTSMDIVRWVAQLAP